MTPADARARAQAETGQARADRELAAKIRAWKASGKQYQAAAAAIAQWAAANPPGTPLPPDYKLTAELDPRPSPAVTRRAKQFLQRNGILTARDGTCVARRSGCR